MSLGPSLFHYMLHSVCCHVTFCVYYFVLSSLPHKGDNRPVPTLTSSQILRSAINQKVTETDIWVYFICPVGIVPPELTKQCNNVAELTGSGLTNEAIVLLRQI